ncbi:hypothetical protein N0V82_002265 [Gnomoniopsis sp. IMI 355080]|nr:hypothetical protein N0V82_002265 [Gnomoniopsis sp. IMI 355080]
MAGVNPLGTIACNLTTVSLDTQPRPTFNALSYVWGDATQRKPVAVNNTPTTVAANLELAMRSLLDRPPSANLPMASIDTPIWVDAIRVNRSDLEERGQQVSMMDAIYSAAHLVLIFLGKGDSRTDWALEQLSDARFQAELHGLGQSNFANTRYLSDEQIRVTHILARNINRHACWSRIWVLQEMVLASRDPIILIGNHDIQLSKAEYPSWVPNFAIQNLEESESYTATDMTLMWDALLGQQQSRSAFGTSFPLAVEGENETDELNRDSLALLLEALGRRVVNRKVIITDAGFAGVGTANLVNGDLVVLPDGANCLYILPPAGLRDLDKITMEVDGGLPQDVILDIS